MVTFSLKYRSFEGNNEISPVSCFDLLFPARLAYFFVWQCQEIIEIRPDQPGHVKPSQSPAKPATLWLWERWLLEAVWRRVPAQGAQETCQLARLVLNPTIRTVKNQCANKSWDENVLEHHSILFCHGIEQGSNSVPYFTATPNVRERDHIR